MSWALFGFGMARVATLALRIAWACKPEDASLTIAAEIFTNVGIVIIYVVVLLLALRTFRALHPELGWKTWLDTSIKVSHAGLGVAIVLVVSFTVNSFYTLNPELQTASRWIQRASILYMLVYNMTALVLFLLCLLLPRSQKAENFGTGSMRTKLLILGLSIFFNLFIAGFRMGTSWVDARPLSNPAWYDSRAAFYVIELFFEIIITYLLLLTRFDKRFWVPNGSSKPGDFSGGSFEDRPESQKQMQQVEEDSNNSFDDSQKLDQEA